jgi:hypothetical protein
MLNNDGLSLRLERSGCFLDRGDSVIPLDLRTAAVLAGEWLSARSQAEAQSVLATYLRFHEASQAPAATFSPLDETALEVF